MVEAFFAMEKFPFAPDMLRIDLEFLAIFRHALPTDFSFWHGLKIISV